MSVIKVQNLSKEYGKFKALKGISFDIKKGEIVGFLGPNGAGKTTTMKILTRYMSASGGSAKIFSHDCSEKSLYIRSKIGYLPENNPLYLDMTVFEYLKYIASLHNVPNKELLKRIKEVVMDCSLMDKIDESIHNLSKGYRQRVGLASALVHDPDILILDEPTAGLDPNQRMEIRNLIQKLGKEKTVIICSHLLNEVELTCNRIIIINAGEIVASGTPYGLRTIVEGHVNLKLVVRGDKQKTLNILEEISTVKNIETSSAKEKGAYAFDLITSKNRDPRPEIARLLVENDLQLLDMHKKPITLEEIFNQVTAME